MNVIEYLKTIETMQFYSFEGFPLLYVLAFLPIIFLSFAILYVIIYCSYLVAATYQMYPLLIKNILNLSFLILSNLFILIILIPFPSLNKPVLITESLFILDNLAQFGQIILVGLSLIALLAVRSYVIRTQMNTFEFFFLILGSILAGLILMFANSFLTFYVAIELQSLLLYLLAGLRTGSFLGTESAIKYFIFGSIASSFLLLGFCFLYGLTGMSTFAEIGQFLCNIDNSPFRIESVYGWVFLSFMFIFIGFFLKMGIVPFHFWIPDVYEGAPLMSTIFYTFLPKISLLIPVIRLVQTVCLDFMWFTDFMCILFGFYSILIGTVFALNQTRLKKLFAYSAITNMGYVIMPTGFLGLENLCSGLLFFSIYALINLGLWLIILSVYDSRGMLAFRSIGDLTGLFYRSPLLACVFACFLLSIAGIPPLVGFFLKLNIITALVNESYFIIAFLTLICSVLSCFYYLRLIKVMFFEKKHKKDMLTLDLCPSLLLILIFFLLFLFSYFPFLIFSFFYL